jgi:hypothetical protein
MAENATLRTRVAKLEKCRLELIDVTNACRDPRVNLTRTLEQCINDLYKRAEAAGLEVERITAIIKREADLHNERQVRLEAAEAKVAEYQLYLERHPRHLLNALRAAEAQMTIIKPYIRHKRYCQAMFNCGGTTRIEGKLVPNRFPCDCGLAETGVDEL